MNCTYNSLLVVTMMVSPVSSVSTIMSEPIPPATDHTLALREEFRHHLETFYAQLKLAPPYESVEKAIRSLTTSVQALPPLERARLATDPTARWQHFSQAFESSGLRK